MIRAPTLSVEKGHVADSANVNVVHEAEAQRQHVRVRLPGSIEFDAGGQRCHFKLADVSAGGFSFEAPNRNFRIGSSARGTLGITVDPVAFSLAVNFQIRSYDPRSGRAGCVFQDLGPREVSALRQLISAFLAGEVVGVGDVLHTLTRNNYTTPRAKPGNVAAMSGGRRMRAMFWTLMALGIGVSAFAYSAKQLHQLLFVTRASVAKVAGPVYTIAMPREGTFYSLVPEDGNVKKGAAIASFEAPVFDLVRGQALSGNLSNDQLSKLLSQTVKGTVTSPCDCRVQTQFVTNAQYVARGQPLFELVPRDFKNPYVMARFRFDRINKISYGEYVKFQVNGDDQRRIGKIIELKIPGEASSVDSDVLVIIAPVDPLPPELVNRPAEVTAGGLILPNLFTVMAATPSGDRAQ